MSSLFPFRTGQRTAEPPLTPFNPLGRGSIYTGPTPRTGSGIIPHKVGQNVRPDLTFPASHYTTGRPDTEEVIHESLTINLRGPKGFYSSLVADQHVPRTPAFISKSKPINQKLSSRTIANVTSIHDMLCWPAMNTHLRSIEGRILYGGECTADKFLQHWGMFGIQVANEEVLDTLELPSVPRTFALKGPYECPNGWLAADERIMWHDNLYLKLVRKEFTAADVDSKLLASVGLNMDSDDDSSVADEDDRKVPNTFWQIEPVVLRPSQILTPNMVGDPFGDNPWYGTCWKIGKVRAFNEPHGYARNISDAQTLARQLIYSTEWNREIKQKYLKLPLVKIDIGMEGN